jgi:hypothetical protein
MRVPTIDGLMMENPTKMDDLGVPPFQETYIYIYIDIYIYILIIYIYIDLGYIITYIIQYNITY